MEFQEVESDAQTGRERGPGRDAGQVNASVVLPTALGIDMPLFLEGCVRATPCCGISGHDV